ncbi:unnamed protein product [Arabidopsis thaliana]|nr:unnamed protein product [Arabidopsis thaliana]
MNLVTSREPDGHIVLYTPSSHLQGPLLMENLYTFEFELVVTSSEFVLEFRADRYKCASLRFETNTRLKLGHDKS